MNTRKWIWTTALSSLLCATGCVSETDSTDVNELSDAIVDVNNSSVKKESISVPMIYASLGMYEALHKNIAGEELNLSESYVTYMFWYDQLVRGNTNMFDGYFHYSEVAAVVERFGLMLEKDFIPEEANAEMSTRQKDALATLRKRIDQGYLKNKSPENVRKELDSAWKLSPTTISTLDKVFGKQMVRWFGMQAAGPIGQGTTIIDPSTFTVQMKLWDAKPQTKKLTEIIFSPYEEVSTGYHAVNYPIVSAVSAAERRKVQKRVQRALHERQPVLVSWLFDANALESGGALKKPPVTPGAQWMQVAVLEDYEVTNVPGFGTLPAGKLESRPAALQAALDDKATVSFFRVKNSSGKTDPKSKAGYLDLYLTYLNGPMRQCALKADGKADLTNCKNITPLYQFILPPGY